MASLFVALQEEDDDPVGDECAGDADDAGADKCGPDEFQRFPIQELGEGEFVQFEVWREMMGTGDDPITEPIFPKEDDWPDGNEHIVERDGDDRGQLAASAEPGGADGEEGLEAAERGEAPEDANGHAAGNGVRRVAQFAETLPVFA